MSEVRQKVTLLFKGGQTFSFTCEEFAATKTQLSNELTGLKWSRAVPDPFYIDLSQVAAIFVQDDD